MHVVAAKAVALGEALRPEFKTYAQAVADNAKVLAKAILNDVASGAPSASLDPSTADLLRRLM